VDENTIPPLTLGTRWAIRDQQTLVRIVEAHRGRIAPEWAQLAARAGKPKAARRARSQQRTGSSVAVIPLTGVITPGISLLSMLFGGSGLRAFRDEFRAALNDPETTAIVLDVDSPGGLIDLVPETAQEIYDARGEKPIVAVANTLMASAAYWVASQADEIVVTPSGDVGSIGVYRLHADWSAYNARIGVDPTYIYAGKHKVDGNPDEPLSDDAREDWQQHVDDLYDDFVADVARGRGVDKKTVIDEYGEGRTMIARRAVAAGMADRIATIEEVVGELLAPDAGSGAAALGRMALATDESLPPLAAASGLDDVEPVTDDGNCAGREAGASHDDPEVRALAAQLLTR
jgi:signal peptide peptidase SppA